MKKIILIIMSIVIIIVAIIAIKYNSYMLEKNTVLKGNVEYEKYTDSEIYGIDLATLINKTIDANEKNEIEKDKNGIFIPNNKNSIQIEIYMQDNETTYKIETIHNMGTEQFVQYYGNIQFKCSKVEYHKSTGKIKYMLFEQLPTS
jgi:hypothetical protein